MEPIEVFLKYCKIRDIIPIMIKHVNYRYNKQFVYNFKKRCYEETYRDFKNVVNSETFYRGFNDLFYEIEYAFRGYPDNPKYHDAKRKWYSFVKNNIKIKNPINFGDKVTVLCDNDTEKEFTFISFFDGFREMVVSDENGRNHYIKLSRLKKVNGNDYVIDFYVKWKGKEYGIDK